MSVRAVLLSLLLLFAPRVSWAQCGGATSECIKCHQTVSPMPWHRDHAFAELCTQCHGGDPSAADAARAHGTLADPRRSCSSCHGDARSYAVAAPPKPAKRTHSGNKPLGAIVTVVLFGGIAFVVLDQRSRR